ncbi:MAG: response regulator transcription factor [Bacteroidales bacterium]|jgi:NarL family two-component system response regulator LiaR|nr:response regulator transcription factor [Bacteroidales bacterium]
MKEKIKIFLVDDHTLFREGLVFLLSDSNFISEIYEAENGKELLKKILNVKPDIILMDIEMPEMNGIEATREVLKLYPETKIIALSMYANENYYSEMIDAGARGFLLKNSKFEDVQKAINEVHQGKNYFSPEILDAIIKSLNKKNKKQNTDLTEREIEILYNICKGLSNQAIADILYISKRTVDKHRENILFKTQSKNTAGLVIYAIKNDIFEV